jgi:hypothetical protein
MPQGRERLPWGGWAAPSYGSVSWQQQREKAGRTAQRITSSAWKRLGAERFLPDRYAQGCEERLYELAAELVRLPVGVIVAGGVPAARAAQQATTTISIVIVILTDPVRAGFVASLARPGGNITGLAGLLQELTGKHLELLKETMP